MDFENSKYTLVFFDGICVLCNGFVDFILSQKGRGTLRFGTLQGRVGVEMLYHYELERDIRTIVVIQNGKVLTRSQAVLEIFKVLGHGWQVLYCLKIVPRYLRDMVYNFVAKRRFRFWGEKSACRMPSTEERLFFLD